MADEPGTQTITPPEGTTPPAGDTTPPAPPAPPADNGLAAQLRIANKELEKLRKADEDRKKAEMTEADRYKLEAEQATARVAALERENQITKAASKAGLPPELWGRVQGTTPEEIEADVTTLLGFVKPATPTPATTGQTPTGTTTPAQGSHKAEWQRLRAVDPAAAAQYYAKNRADILRE